jgi:hemerythrin-like domain-containing protein
MSEAYRPNVARSLLRVHMAITRALDVIIDRSRSFAEQGFVGASLRAGFASYVSSLASFLSAHHLSEDELAFPYFRGKMPEAPFDSLMAQHKQMLPLLDEIEAAAQGIAADIEVSEPLSSLDQATSQLREMWRPHIGIEETYYVPEKMDALLDLEEQARLIKLFAQYSQEHSGPDYLVMPFFLFNLPAQERALLSHEVPEIVTQQLVPVVWKEKWAPMAPFLLG